MSRNGTGWDSAAEASSVSTARCETCGKRFVPDDTTPGDLTLVVACTWACRVTTLQVWQRRVKEAQKARPMPAWVQQGAIQAALSPRHYLQQLGDYVQTNVMIAREIVLEAARETYLAAHPALATRLAAAEAAYLTDSPRYAQLNVVLSGSGAQPGTF